MVNIEKLSSVPYGQRLSMHKYLSELIAKVSKESNSIQRIEKSLARTIIKRWNTMAKAAIEDATDFPASKFNQKFTSDDGSEVSMIIEEGLRTFNSDKLQKRIKKDLEQTYMLEKLSVSSKNVTKQIQKIS